MRILVACEESQTVTIKLRSKGHEAYSCDTLPCGGPRSDWHIQGDVRKVLSKKWDMILAFPPCTHLCVSGARHFEGKRADGRQRDAILFFLSMINADCPKIAVENPVGIISGKYIQQHFPELALTHSLPLKVSQIIQPYEFGDPVKKSTCLWLKGLPNLKGTNNVESEVEYYTTARGTGKQSAWNARQLIINGKKYGYNTPEFKRHRSKTFDGIAQAMADQWAGEV